MDARFTAGRLSHREARMCHQMMPPGSPDPMAGGPPVVPTLPSAPRPPVGPPEPMITARVGGAADVLQQLLASNFLRESRVFMARFNDIPRRFAGRPDRMWAEMRQAIDGANCELEERHRESRGNYPLYKIVSTLQGLVAFMIIPRSPMSIPLGGPQLPPGMMDGPAVPGMPNSMAMMPGGVMRPSMIPGRPGMVDYPPQPAGPETVAFVRGLYLSRNPDRMTPQMRTLWQQTVIGGLELLGFVTPSSLSAVIGTPPTEQLTLSGTRMQPLFRVIGAIRLIGVAIAYDRLRSGRTGPGDIPPVDVNAAIDTVNRDPGRLVNVGVVRGPDNRITSVSIKPRLATDPGFPATATPITNAEIAQRLRAQGLADTGPNAQFRESDGIVLTNPTPETMQALLRALQSMTNAEIIPPATSEARINTYKTNANRKVNVNRVPATGALTSYELTPRTDAGVPEAQRVTPTAVQEALVKSGIPAANVRIDGPKVVVSGDGVNTANLVKLATVLETLVTGPATAPTLSGGPTMNRLNTVNRNAKVGADWLKTLTGAETLASGVIKVTRGGVDTYFKFVDGNWKWGSAEAGPYRGVDGGYYEREDEPAREHLKQLNDIARDLQKVNTGDAPTITRLETVNRKSTVGADWLRRLTGAEAVAGGVIKVSRGTPATAAFFKFVDGNWKWSDAADGTYVGVDGGHYPNETAVGREHLKQLNDIARTLRKIDTGT